MKIDNIRRISTVLKMKSHPQYHLAKSSDIDAAQRLVNQTVSLKSEFKNDN